MRDLPESVLRFDLRKIDDLCGQVFRDLLLVQLPWNDLAQFRGDHPWMWVVFPRDIDAKYLRMPDTDVVCFLEMKLFIS